MAAQYQMNFVNLLKQTERIARMETNPESMPWQSFYKLLIGSIVPRPIGWVSTVNAQGQPNLAPFSFFNAVNANPPHVLFCPSIRAADRSPKDTLNNIRATGEFVINIVTEDLAEAMNLTATEVPAEINEFERAGLETAPSVVVNVPRVARSPIHYECKLTQIVELGDGVSPGSGWVVIGRIVHAHVDESVLIGTDKIDLQALKPIGRLAGNAYSRVTDIFELTRQPSEIKQSGFKSG
jgi:flavin reductase (DIM6/NTAB) family NADH-FMN oxidoreductase RutF